MAEKTTAAVPDAAPGFALFVATLESCFRAMAAAATAHRPPDTAIGAAIYRHAPAALQAVLGAAGEEGQPEVRLDASVMVEIRENGTAIPAAEPASELKLASHPGHELSSSASILGVVEQHFGADILVLFQRWQHAMGYLAQDLKTRTEFCDQLARRVVGYLGDSLPGVGSVPLLVWESPQVIRPGLKEFASAAGQAMFEIAQAARLAQLGWPADHEKVKQTPEIAVIEGARLAGRIEEANGRNIEDIVSHIRFDGEHRTVAEIDMSTISMTQFAAAVASVAVGVPRYRPNADDLEIVVPALVYDHDEGLDPFPQTEAEQQDAAEAAA